MENRICILKQGSLDSLCGVYAVINSISLLSPRKIDSEIIFSTVMHSIGSRLPRLILEGFLVQDLVNHVLEPSVLLLSTIGLALTYEVATADSLAHYWKTMAAHWRQHGSGSILLSMTGTRNHWTCINRISQRCLVLADSGGIKRLYRAKVTIGAPNTRRPHCLWPSETFLLSLGR